MFRRLLCLFDNLFFEQREKLCLNVSMCCSEAVFAVNVSNDGLDAGRISKSTEKFVGGQMGEPYAIHTLAFLEDVFAGVKGKHCIADPGGFAFDFESFVPSHAADSVGWIKGLRVFLPSPEKFFCADALRNRHPNTPGAALKKPCCREELWACGSAGLGNFAPLILTR
jgi:hypothetical protein